MEYGFDIEENTPTVCSVRSWDDHSTAAIQLIAFGPEPASQSVMPNAKYQAVHMVRKRLETAFDHYYNEGKTSDLRFLSMQIGKVLKKANTFLRELNRELGQGIYIGGNVLFYRYHQIFLFSFGGCSTVNEAGGKLYVQGKPELGNISMTALGAAQEWEDLCWFNTIYPETRLLLLSSALVDPTPILKHIRDCDTPGALPNTLAMALCRWLSQRQHPAAVLDLRL